MKKLSLKNINTYRKPILFCLLFLFLFPSLPAFSKPQAAANNTETQKTRQYMELIYGLYDYVQRNFVDDIDARKIYEGALQGIMNSLEDPYSVYLDEKRWKNITTTTQGNFNGVGLSIVKESGKYAERNPYVEVVSPVEGGPGEKAGIRTGDKIIAINGLDTKPMNIDEVLSHLRGPHGEAVELTLKRGENLIFNRTIIRDVIEIPTVKYGMTGKTGYLRIIEFTPQTIERVDEALASFKMNNFDSLIIDLRNNPGGLITSAVDIADRFIRSGTIVSTKSRVSYENTVYTAAEKKTVVPEGFPVFVLINRGSASASEILSGSLKDNHIAYLIGDRTYGKGSVQQVIPLPNDDGIKMTVARYYTPSDVCIDKIGIPPDKEVLYPPFTQEEELAFIDLENNDVIYNYVSQHPGMTEDDIASYAVELHKENILSERVLRRIIRNEVRRYDSTYLFDLDYDLQIIEALNLIQNEDFQTLISKTKTLRELQEEAELTGRQEEPLL